VTWQNIAEALKIVVAAGAAYVIYEWLKGLDSK
jgi:hypothetical protein